MLVRARSGAQGEEPNQKPLTLPRRVLSEVFFALKHAGYGTILSVCFVHLLIHAFIYFSNECVQPLAYEATPAAITMAGTLFVFVLDFFLLRSVRRRAAELNDGANVTSIPSTPTEKDAEIDTLPSDTASGTSELQLAKAKVQSYELLIFELSILLHSAIIGVTLGAQTGSGWSIVLIAVA
jgi:solute carrier family 39 (zinc transporter), member 1/2/3